MEQDDLLRQAKRGDPDTFEALTAPYLTGLYRTAGLVLLDRELARDAVQEALVRAFKSIDRFRSGHSLRPWLYRLTVNEARRLGGRQGRQPLPVAELPEQPDASTPEAQVLTAEERQQLWQALAQLPPDHRTVLVLRYYQELSEIEMADVLRVRPGTVKSRLSRARQALAVILAGSQGEVDRTQVAPTPQVAIVRKGRLPYA